VRTDPVPTDDVNLWVHDDHAQRYLEVADGLPHRRESEQTLLEVVVPALSVREGPVRILDLGCGDGRLLALVRSELDALGGSSTGVAVDFNTLMLEAAEARFTDAPVDVVIHDLSRPLPELGRFDAVVSSFAIHHLVDERKQALYREAFDLLLPGGVFANLEHVASPTESLHVAFLAALGHTLEHDDPSNRLVDAGLQVAWLREIGFADVDIYWKWRELSLLAGVKPA
jgi:tRNA (cmo5U34)-methyltransferase